MSYALVKSIVRAVVKWCRISSDSVGFDPVVKVHINTDSRPFTDDHNTVSAHFNVITNAITVTRSKYTERLNLWIGTKVCMWTPTGGDALSFSILTGIVKQSEKGVYYLKKI